MEVQPLFEAGAQGLVEGHQDHVEVELVQALFVLGTVHGAQVRVDADAGQVFDIGLQDAFEVGVHQQQFHAQLLALAVHQPLAIEFPARLAEQGQGLAQGLAADAAPVGMADLVGLGEHLFRQLVTKWRQQQPFLAGGQAVRCELAVG